MSDKWNVKGSGGFLSGIKNVTPDTFTGTHKDTGEKVQVVAWDKQQAGEKISTGDVKKK